MKQECDKLKTKPLDHTYHDIMEDIKSSKNEIQDLRRSLERLEMYCIKNEAIQWITTRKSWCTDKFPWLVEWKSENFPGRYSTLEYKR